MNLSSEDREEIARRMAELQARMDELRPLLNSATISEWVAAYNERATLEQQLGEDP